MSQPYPSGPKKLERSTTDKFLAGVCGGVARYLNMDPTLVRVLWVILTLVLGGAPLIVYLVMLFVVPEENTDPGYPASVHGAQGQQPWAPYPQYDQAQPTASPGPSPQHHAAPSDTSHPDHASGDRAVWGDGGAPWNQPNQPAPSAQATSSAQPTASTQPVADDTTDQTTVNPVAGTEATPSTGAGTETGTETHTEPDTGSTDDHSETIAAADHNEPARGQQPTS